VRASKRVSLYLQSAGDGTGATGEIVPDNKTDGVIPRWQIKGTVVEDSALADGGQFFSTEVQIQFLALRLACGFAIRSDWESDEIEHEMIVVLFIDDASIGRQMDKIGHVLDAGILAGQSFVPLRQQSQRREIKGRAEGGRDVGGASCLGIESGIGDKKTGASANFTCGSSSGVFGHKGNRNKEIKNAIPPARKCGFERMARLIAGLPCDGKTRPLLLPSVRPVNRRRGIGFCGGSFSPPIAFPRSGVN